MKRKTKIGFAIVLLGMLIGAVLIVLYYFKCTASYRGSIKGDVLDEVVIERDKRGMPFIRARRLEDVYFTLGYLHAQDRLLQIEYQRALARGRISEIIGLRGVVVDKLSRTVGFFQRADRIMGELSSPYREYLDAYVSGINHFRSTGENELFTGYLPEEEWNAVDVLSILLLFEWAHSYGSNHELLFPLPEGFEGPLWELIPEKLHYRYRKEDRENILFLKEINRVLREFVGSYLNGFAVYLSGTHTKTGNSILFSSLDSGIGTYPLWYPVSVTVEPLSVNGCTIAGLPFIMVGKNNYISFC
jgi:penicillin amidase